MDRHTSAFSFSCVLRRRAQSGSAAQFKLRASWNLVPCPTANRTALWVWREPQGTSILGWGKSGTTLHGNLDLHKKAVKDTEGHHNGDSDSSSMLILTSRKGAPVFRTLL